MDLISRISQHFTDSAQTKLDAIEMLAAPIAGATELMVGALINNGKILACGNGGSAALPDLPTVAEQGFPGFDATTWNGFMAPAGTPKSYNFV